MDTIILIIIAASIVLFTVGYLASAVILASLIKFFKIENTSFKKSLVIVLFLMLSGLIINAILGIINLGAISNIFSMAILFLTFYYLLKKYYQIDWKKSLLIFILFSGAITVLSFLIVIPVRQYIAQPFYVNGDSMSPNYNQNDYLLISMFNRQFFRGDVIIYRNPKDNNQFLIKRIVGLPEEKIEIKNGNITIDGQNLNEPYTKAATAGNINLTLNSDEYFVLGDNRGKSFDSRFHGPVKNTNIVGKIIYNFTAQK